MRHEMARMVARLLIKNEALQIDAKCPFKLRSGKFSPVYFNCRKLMADPNAMKFTTIFMQQIVANHPRQPDIIVGGETAGIPFATSLAHEMHKPLSYVRKKEKTYGNLGGTVEGANVRDRLVLLVEDMITDGGSKLEFVKTLQSRGAALEYCLVVFDRDQGGKEELANQRIKLESLCTLEDLLCEIRPGKISQENINEMTEYLKDPDRWSAQYEQEKAHIFKRGNP